MKYTVFRCLSILQYFLLYVFYAFFSVFIKRRKGAVIGVSEMAKMLYFYGKIIPGAKTVCLDVNKYYNLDYSYSLNVKNRFLFVFSRFFYGPILFAYLSSKYDCFFYFWSTGFLFDREFDFYFLKKKNIKIVTVFVGDDIRSPVKLKQELNELKYDGFIDYVGVANPYYLSSAYDDRKKKIATLSDKYASVCFSCSVDQKSYILSKQYFLSYAYDKAFFNKNKLKYENIDCVKILHAPSHPFIKGTPLVRSAIKKLQLEGYNIYYKELIGVPNSVVIEELKSSHIVLNQFYAFAPGVFGVEAMANHCAVLMSADPDIETGLPQSSKGAWMITPYWQVYDNLKFLLDNPSEIKKYADAGYEFTYNHYTYEKASEYIQGVLKENGISL